MVASVVTSAAAVLVLLASSAAAADLDTVTADVLRTVEDGVASGVTNVQTRLAGMQRYTGVGEADIPDECVIYMDPFNPLAAGDTNDNDKRDDVSGYVCNVDDIDLTTVFRTKKGQEKGGFTLQSIDNEMGNLNSNAQWAEGWFLSVHDYYKNDKRFPGYVSAILHGDEKKAAVWELEVLPGKNPAMDDFAHGLKLVVNRESGTAYTEGWYLTVPPGAARDRSTNYVAVTSNRDKATPVFVAYY